MNGPQPVLDYDEARRKAEDLHRRRAEGIALFEERTNEAAQKERTYRQTKSVAFAKARFEEKGVGEAEIIANGAAADARYERDIAAGLVQAQRQVLEALEADRAMLRHFSDWSQRINGAAA